MKKQGKKILKGVLIAILVGDLIVFGIYLYSYEKFNMKNQEDAKDDVVNTIEEEDKVDEVIIEEDIPIQQEEVKEYISEDKDDGVKLEENIEINNTNNSTQKSTESKKTQVTTSNNNQKNNIQTSTQIEVKHDVPKTVTPTVEEPKTQKEEQKVIETPKQEEPKQDVHTYKYNSAIVEKIKQDIKNNESTYMKEYGYNIVVDESIVTQTNQFTYTNNRVKYMIEYKFGTIKIYARDYYLNGNYMYTECYII